MIIYKYDIPSTHGMTIDFVLPALAKPLCVMMQNGEPKIWFELAITETIHTKMFSVTCIGTGNNFTAEGEYIGSLIDGPFVWHYYIAEQ